MGLLFQGDLPLSEETIAAIGYSFHRPSVTVNFKSLSEIARAFSWRLEGASSVLAWLCRYYHGIGDPARILLKNEQCRRALVCNCSQILSAAAKWILRTMTTSSLLDDKAPTSIEKWHAHILRFCDAKQDTPDSHERAEIVDMLLWSSAVATHHYGSPN